MDFTLACPHRFPEGTSVGAYPASNWPAQVLSPSGAPLGAATDTQSVASGSLAFTGLVSGTRYFAAADVNGIWRYVAFTAGADTAERHGLPQDIPTDRVDADAIAAGAVGASEIATGALTAADAAADLATQAELDTAVTGKQDAATAATDAELASHTGATPATTTVHGLTRQAAYTQTFATAARTHPAAAQTAVATTGATAVTPNGYTTAAQANDIVTQLNRARDDIAALKQLVNAVIDDLQANSLAA